MTYFNILVLNKNIFMFLFVGNGKKGVIVSVNIHELKMIVWFKLSCTLLGLGLLQL